MANPLLRSKDLEREALRHWLWNIFIPINLEDDDIKSDDVTLQDDGRWTLALVNGDDTITQGVIWGEVVNHQFVVHLELENQKII